MQSFREASTWSIQSPGVLSAHLDAQWTQGRALFGGVVMAGALRGLQDQVPADRRLRMVMTSFHAPVKPEPFTCHLDVLRSGSSFTHTRARIVQRDQVCVDVTAGFGTDRPPGLVVPAEPAPPYGSPEELPTKPFIGDRPAFAQHFDLVMAPEYRPFSGRETPGMRCWVREANATLPWDAIQWVALLDVPPPPVWPTLKGPARGSTIHFQATVLSDGREEMPGDAWALFASEVNASDGAYCDYRCGLWSRQGTPLAIGKQVFADFSGVRR